VNLSGANLARARLSFANLTRADLTEADLTEADLTEADLTGASLTEARGLTQEQLDTTKGDETTKLPPGLRHPEGWRRQASDPD
jgi:uncharacterized protein YjbI with pentapeptide repeats